ncbi:MAG TPA: hypothetical protein VIY72_14155 [Acidimicrobiales bacterium]
MTAAELPDTLGPARGSRYPCKLRTVLGLFAAEGTGHDEFVAGLTEWHRTVALEWRGRGWSTRTGVRIAGTEPLLQASIGDLVGETISPIDGFATIDLEDYDPTAAQFDRLLEPVEDLADSLAGIIDPARSFAMAGLANLVLAGEGPVAMMLMCTHRSGVDLVDTHTWWCSFGDVMRSAPSGHTLGYHQVQCDPELSQSAAQRSGLSSTAFDLGDLVYLTDVDSFVVAATAHRPSVDPGPPINQRDDFITFEGAVGAFCTMLAP